MKRIIIMLLALLLFTLFTLPASALGRIYTPKRRTLYTIKDDGIQPGIYTLSVESNDPSERYATITIGDNLQLIDNKITKEGEYTEYTLTKDNPSKQVELPLGTKLYIDLSLGLVTLTSESTLPNYNSSNETKSDSENSPISKFDNTPGQKTSTTEKKLSQEEITKIVNSAPYVSNKNIVIDSPDGVDFYTYFGSGIIMSGTSGDCFKMVECDDEAIVDHYKLMPIKVGHGKVEYVINMQKKIIVNITVKDSALNKDNVSNEEEVIGRVIKGVNIRSKASADSNKVGSLKKGEKVKVITPFYRNGWHEIEYQNKVCYVSAKYIELE